MGGGSRRQRETPGVPVVPPILTPKALLATLGSHWCSSPHQGPRGRAPGGLRPSSSCQPGFWTALGNDRPRRPRRRRGADEQQKPPAERVLKRRSGAPCRTKKA